MVAEGSGDIGARVEAWLAQELVPPPIDEITFLTMPVNLFDRPSVDAIVALIRRDDYKLVVIDTLARSMDGGDENSAKDASTVIAAADALRDASGACVLLVHHSGYDATHARGSTAFRGACDTELEVKKSDDLVILTAKKQKSRRDGDRWFLKLDERASSRVVVEAHGKSNEITTSALDVLTALREHDDGSGMTSGQWQAVAETGTIRTFHRLKKQLTEAGLVTREGKGNSCRYHAAASDIRVMSPDE